MRDMIFWGILVSLAFTELSGISPGGVIVPAYIMLYIHDPLRVILTLAISLACMGIVRLLSRYMILYGRRRFAVYMMVGILLKLLLGIIYTAAPIGVSNLSQSIGFLIPGLIGRDVERQGILPTFVSIAIVCCLLWLLRIVLGRVAL